MTFAPSDAAISLVLSLLSASTTTISSAHATDSIAALMFDSSFSVMMVAVIFKLAQITQLGAGAPSRSRKLVPAAAYCSCPLLNRLVEVTEWRLAYPQSRCWPAVLWLSLFADPQLPCCSPFARATQKRER